MTPPNHTAPSATRTLDWPLILFFVIAYAIAWGTFALIGVIANQSGVADAQTLLTMGETMQFNGASLSVPQWLVYLLTRLADFSFSIAGIIMIAATTGRAGLRQLWQRLTHWQVSWVWYAAGLLPIALYMAATIVAGAIPSLNHSLNSILTALFSLQAGWFVSLFLRGAMGEELGLRGFALPRLQARLSPFWASLIIGVFWGLWHLPVLIGRDILSIVIFGLLSVGLSMLFTGLFNGSGGSLIPVLLFHATQNWEEGFETFFPSLVNSNWELVSTLSLLVVCIIAAVLVWRSSRAANYARLANGAKAANTH